MYLENVMGRCQACTSGSKEVELVRTNRRKNRQRAAPGEWRKTVSRFVNQRRFMLACSLAHGFPEPSRLAHVVV
jgi:hypothetical protein